MESSDGPFVQRYLPLVREAAAVVAAILIAFAIDAWWEARGVAGDTEEALVSLEAELRENRELINTAIQDDAHFVSTIDAMLKLEPAEVQEISEDSVTQLLRVLSQGTTFNPSEGAIESVISTGVLEEIDSSELRQAIAGLPGRISDPIEEMDQMWLTWGRFVDHGIETGTFSSFVALDQGIGAQKLSGREILSTWLGDEGFREIFAALAYMMESYRAELEMVGPEIDRTRSLLLEEIGR